MVPQKSPQIHSHQPFHIESNCPHLIRDAQPLILADMLRDGALPEGAQGEGGEGYGGCGVEGEEREEERGEEP